MQQFDIVIVGAGTAGLTAAIYALRAGKTVLVTEGESFGGQITSSPRVENYPGISQISGSEFADNLVSQAMELGADVELEKVIKIVDGKIKTVITDSNSYQCKCVIIATGARHRPLGADGENDLAGRGVSYCAVCDGAFYKGKNVAVVGGGNVAMDAARSALRMGAEHVYIVYRRSEAEMPARKEEVHHAKEEGVEFQNLCNPTEILGGEDGRVCGLKCIRMELGEPDESGRRRPVAIPGSEYVLDVDTVIMSIGTSPNPLIRTTTAGLEANKRGCLIVNEDTMQTTKDGVYAGGDAVTGAATVILAMGAGKKAAASIDEYIKAKA